jgi:hypothetical protein
LLIRLLSHFGHFFITIITKQRQQKFCYKIFGIKKKTSDYLEIKFNIKILEDQLLSKIH